MNWLSGFITTLSSIVFTEFVIHCQGPKPGSVMTVNFLVPCRRRPLTQTTFNILLACRSMSQTIVSASGYIEFKSRRQVFARLTDR